MPKIEKIPLLKEAKASTQTARATVMLREMLVQGKLRAGERIREVPLATQLNVSRIPLHLALERLAHEGFLEVRPKRGFIVQQFSTEDIYDAVELRGLLEGAAARLAAERSGSQDLKVLEETSRAILTLVRPQRLTMEGFRRYIELNAQFHAELVRLSGSRMLRQAIERICCLPFASPSAFLQRQTFSANLRELFMVSADQHCCIVEAIGRREGMRAETITREHARVALRNLEDALKHRDIPRDMAGVNLISI